MSFNWLNWDGDSSNIYGNAENAINNATVSMYQFLAKLGVYASGLAILVAAALLIIHATSGGEKLADAKRHVVRVLIVSILIFGASGLVLMVSGAGFN